MKKLDPALYTIAWIAPLEIEAQAALHMLDNRHDGRFPVNRGDDYIFSAGDINGHNTIIATLPAGQEYGTGSAAALASQIKILFTNLWCGLLVGVAAGLPDLRKTPPIDIRLGDVLVGLSEGESAGLVAYDLGKETSEGFQLLRSGRVLANTETVIRSAIGNIKIKAPDDTDTFLPFYESVKDKEHSKGTFEDPGQEKDIFYDIGDDGVDNPVQRLQRPTDRRTRVWYGSIGSGDKLTKNTRKRNEIRDRYGVIGLEMEAAGTMNRIPVGVIRGVCDYADEHKNKEWQPYAAAMAASYAKAVIYELGPGKVMPSSSLTNEAKHALYGTILCGLPPTTDRFFGREAELLEMIACLESTNQRKGVVLCGISGSGKTQLAREYVAQRSEKFSAILWIDASSEESIEESFSSCSSSIHEHNPKFRTERDSTPPRQLVLEWLRTAPDKNWLTVVDNANGPIPNKRLLGPFMGMNHGSLCVISTKQVTARAVRLKQILVEYLDARASQSLLLWRAYESDTEYEEDGKFILFHLPRSLLTIQNYPELAQFEIDSGAWIWTSDGANESLFSMLDSLYASVSMKNKESALLVSLCSIYGPSAIPISLLYNPEMIDMEDTENQDSWKQLKALTHSKIKLSKAIDELSKIFLATKKQANDYSLLSFSLHASISIDYIRCTGPDDPDESILLRLLVGLARCCENIREFEMAEEALLSAYNISTRMNGHMDNQTISLASRLKVVRYHILTELENRKRVLVASTGTKLAPDANSSTALDRQTIPDAEDFGRSRTDSVTKMTNFPDVAWELRFSHPILVLSLQDDGNGLSGFPHAFPITIRGSANIMAYERIDIRSIHIEICLVAWDVEGWRKGKQPFDDAAASAKWKLTLCDSSVTSDERFGDNCTFRLDNESSQENTRRPNSGSNVRPDHIAFLPGSYCYSFETTIDCSLYHPDGFVYGDILFDVSLIMEFPDSKPHIELRKEIPAIQIPRQPMPERTSRSPLTRQQGGGISFCVDLPYRITSIGGRIPITVTLSPLNNEFRAEYLTYSIVQRVERWTKDRLSRKTDEQKLVLLEKFRPEESTLLGNDNSTEQDGEEAGFSFESDDLPKVWFAQDYLLNLDLDKPLSVSDDLMLPTCKQIEAGRWLGQEPLHPTCSTSFIKLSHFIQVTVGVSSFDSNQSESQILETTEEIPIAIIDCRINHRRDLLVDSMAQDLSPAGNRTTICGCPDAEIYENGFSSDVMQPGLRPKAKLCTTTPLYVREVYGPSKSDVRHKNERLEEAWSQPIPNTSKPQHWEVGAMVLLPILGMNRHCAAISQINGSVLEAKDPQ
ncbi:calcium-independent phospholipase A2 [Fusarium pseudoanthophilum]|uniref:Calcium-independent phospholipase A2 n=1 Tax=Fusarium pseudoanthophilum TaxID=48495 RepID=A0A8H5KCN2_9HYPO|nr:calcium-independent phospholipase A2 [Fusarium pseudoanthophilum]